MIGQYRIVPKGTEFWSIANQTNFITTKDEIILVKHTCAGSTGIFGEPQQLIFNMVGFIPTIIGKGGDEWSLDYSNTLPYEIPQAEFNYNVIF